MPTITASLAFANTIEAIILGSNRADATMAGLGRGAGNCPMELLLGFLRNPKFKLRPIVKLLEEHILPLRDTVDWGPSVPYNITGQMNLHPPCRDGMARQRRIRSDRQILRQDHQRRLIERPSQECRTCAYLPVRYAQVIVAAYRIQAYLAAVYLDARTMHVPSTPNSASRAVVGSGIISVSTSISIRFLSMKANVPSSLMANS